MRQRFSVAKFVYPGGSYSDVPVAHLAGPRSIPSPMSILDLYISIGSLL
jgi:hypothetical protein